MQKVILADKYAKALIAYAQEANIIDRIDRELASLEKIFTEERPSLHQILLNPAISLQEKKDLLEAVCKEERISQQAQAFLFVLLKSRRISLFSETSKIYRDLVHSLRKKLKVIVETASSLGPGE